jgi:hypothetical protein
VRLRHIALAAGSHAIDLATVQTVDNAQPVAGGRDHRLAAADGTGAEPKFPAANRVVRLNALVAVDNHFAPRAGSYQDRRVPAAMIAALSPPDFLASFFVERDEIRVFIRVAVLNHLVVHQDRTGCRAPGPFERPEVAGPEMLAIRGVSVNSTATEERDHHFAIGRAAR